MRDTFSMKRIFSLFLFLAMFPAAFAVPAFECQRLENVDAHQIVVVDIDCNSGWLGGFDQVFAGSSADECSQKCNHARQAACTYFEADGVTPTTAPNEAGMPCARTFYWGAQSNTPIGPNFCTITPDEWVICSHTYVVSGYDNNQKITICPRGFVNNGDHACKKVAPGYYEYKADNWPSNINWNYDSAQYREYFGWWQLASAAMLECEEGFFCPGFDSKKTECPANHYCPAKSANPVACPSGATSEVGSNSLNDCVINKNYDETGTFDYETPCEHD